MPGFVPLGDVPFALGGTPGPDGDLVRKNLRALVSFLASATFTAPTLLNGWANFGGTVERAGFLKDALGFVHLKGVVLGGAVSASIPIFILPAECRPAFDKVFAVDSNNAHGRCTINRDGRVLPEVGSATYFSLDGLTFKAG